MEKKTDLGGHFGKKLGGGSGVKRGEMLPSPAYQPQASHGSFRWNTTRRWACQERYKDHDIFDVHIDVFFC